MRRPTAALIALAACSTGFQKQSIVVDLRILAMRTDPAEVVVDLDPSNPAATSVPPITVTALVADPGASRRLSWTLTACPINDVDIRCDDSIAPIIQFGQGTIDDPETTPPTGLTAALQATPELITAAIAADPAGGFGGVQVQLQLAVWPEGADPATAIYASKLIVYAPRVPANRVANTNPSLADLQADGTSFPTGDCEDPATVPLVVAPDTVVTLTPIEPPGVRETYVLPTFGGGTRTFTENMRYAWFATAGDFSSENTGGAIDAFGNNPPLLTKWASPTPDQLSSIPDGKVRLWVVMRDERGGTYWTERCFVVQN